MFTPTTRRKVEDDGCAIAGVPHTSAAFAALLLPALLLILARPR